MPRLTRLGVKRWLLQAASSPPNCRLDLSRLSQESLADLEYHLTEFATSLAACERYIGQTFNSAPNSETLEDALVESEIELRRANLQFGEIVAILRRQEMWMEDDL